MTSQLSLEELVSSVASDLMGVTEFTLVDTVQRMLFQLVEYFEVDTSFLRRNDHDIGATVLIAEWPPRPNIPEPDPIGVVYFAGADSTFAMVEHMSAVTTMSASHQDEGYRELIEEATGVPQVSWAMVPLLEGPVTTGVLGFIKFGEREWLASEINALRAVAGLLVQLQARVAAEERLRFLAYHDELTGLLNRRGLTDHLADRLNSGAPGPVAVIFMDVDRLKALNSFLGHAAGDQYLQTLACRLGEGESTKHCLARLGGDEFVMVMEGPTTLALACEEANRLKEVANQPILAGGESVRRAVSFGVALGEPGIMNVLELVNQADQAMLLAKSQGGNEIVVFTAAMRLNNEVRTDIELHLATAIQDGAMVLHYQPEVDLTTGAILGFEALVRWQHPHLGLLGPNEFIEVVEATNLSGELSRWVIETGCRQLKNWHRLFPEQDLRMSVNISPAQLISLDFVDSVAEILAAEHLDGHYLTLEITEHGVFRDADSALLTLLGLQAIGVKVAIDDFGTGYSSFAHLKLLPVNTLKIDQTFVKDLGADANDLAIVQSIVGLATAFDLQLVAEGVETEAAAATLLALGCHRAQGYLLGRPMPMAEAEARLRMGPIQRPSVNDRLAG